MIKPWHIPNNFDSYLLIKICQCQKYRDEFIAGKFFMNTFGEIRKKENLRKGQFDENDGSELFLQTTNNTYWRLELINNEYWSVNHAGRPINNNYLVEASIGGGQNLEKKLFCMYTLWGDSHDKKFLPIDPKVIDEFGEYAAVVINTPVFLNRIQEKLDSLVNQMNDKPRYDFVEYVKHDKNSPAIPLGIFRKFQEEYIHQNEFRISLDMKNIIGPFKDFSINCSDICIPVKTEELIRMNKILISQLIFGHL